MDNDSNGAKIETAFKSVSRMFISKNDGKKSAMSDSQRKNDAQECEMPRGPQKFVGC